MSVTRPRRPRYRSDAMAQLARQLHFAAPEIKREQVRRAERLHDELNPTHNYPFDFIQYRITGYRREIAAEISADLILVGDALLPDLRQFIDELSRSVGMPSTQSEPTLGLEELARELRVSVRTVQRWRREGLRWRWVLEAGQPRKRLGFTRSAVARFTQDAQPRLARAAQFSRLTRPQRQRLLERARRLTLAQPVTLNQVATHLARRTGRAVETVRQLLLQHDQRHPEAALFADRDRPLTRAQRHAVCRAYRRGIPVARLSAQFGRVRSGIYRTIRQRRAMALQRLPLRYHHLPQFTAPDAAAQLTTAGWPTEPAPRPVVVADLSAELAPWFAAPAGPVVSGSAALLGYHFHLWRADQARRQLDPHEPRSGALRQIEADLQAARTIRRQLLADHLWMVLSLARQQWADHAGGVARLLELLLAGVQVLDDAVLQFEPGRNRSFESFLQWRLQRAYALAMEPPPGAPRAHRRIEPEALAQRISQQLRRLGIADAPAAQKYPRRQVRG